MRIERLGPVDGAAAERIADELRALVPGRESVEAAVAEIVDRVRREGDAAVVECTRRFDTEGREPLPLRVESLRGLVDDVAPDVVAALELAADNVRAVAEAWLADDREVALAQGQRIVLREVPVRSAAVYVPGGRAPYPSTVVMGVATAQAAGVEDVAVCSPPGLDGEVDRTVLAACALLGVSTVYRMGGAQAIAALAFGTESVAPVDVVVGPGNLYVQEAKRQVSGAVGTDGFAGPSDLVVVLDDGVRDAALDLLAQAEHGPGTLVVAVSPVADALASLADDLRQRTSGAGGDEDAVVALVEVVDWDVALAVAERFAPEHLQLMGPGAEALAPRVRRAGCLFVGEASGTAFGDYVAGSNHVLPTEGAARFASGLNPGHFRRRMAEVHVGDAAAELARAAAPLARAEGFELHAESMEARIRDNRPS